MSKESLVPVAILQKLFENETVEVYRIESPEYTRASVARALKKQPADLFNIVDKTDIKYYSPTLPTHAIIIDMYERFGPPIVVLWKKLPAPPTPGQ